MKESDEFSILEKLFQNLGSQYNDSSDLLIGPGDDSGLFSNKKSDLIFSTDLAVSGIHFPRDLSADLIAFRACAIAASDIPACGGELKWISISLVTASKDIQWLEKFSLGIKEFTDLYKIPVIGGDLSSGKECCVSVGVCGKIEKNNFLRRSGARANDSIFITGEIGQAYLGLKLYEKNKSNLSADEKTYYYRYLKPELRTSLATDLPSIANSCIDISDGLLADLGHICSQSKLKANLDLELIPYIGDYNNALAWGDDYELCFTANSNNKNQILNLGKKHNLKVTKIGEMAQGEGVNLFKDGKSINLERSGYNHFSNG
tara:strand:- start:3032 stop:3985 length:954 start_codon:yes stop_codon:yes gene_type:complete